MNVKANLVYLGIEAIPSKKVAGKIYNKVNFVDGVNTCSANCEDIALFANMGKLNPLTPVTCGLEIRLGKYTSVELTSCEKGA